jgi:type I restriction enzyme M protein
VANSISTRPIHRMTQAELDGFLEKAADILRGNVDHSEFRGYVFALLFYKRISDVFEENIRLLEKRGVPSDLARFPGMHEFVVPDDWLWGKVVRSEPRTLGQALNNATIAIERANAPKFDGILANSSVDFNAQETIPRSKLIDLINHFSSRTFDRSSVPDDVFGDAYEYLIRTFASKAGKSSGEFYTPHEVAFLMSEIIAPQPGDHICDWAAGAGGLIVQCRRYVEKHFGPQKAEQLFLYLQESNLSTYNISRINLILHGIRSANHKREDSLRQPQFIEGHSRRLRQFDRIVMNPPFSLESWGYNDFSGGDPYARFAFGLPPRDNGDYAWLLHVVKSLKPTGKAIVVMSQGVLFRGQPEQTEAEDGRNQKADAEYILREGFINNDWIECVIVLPQKLFYGNNVPGCLVVLNKAKSPERKGKILMIWAARHFQNANPQNILRRVDCMRILIPWRAFGNLEKCQELIPQHERELISDIEDERDIALGELHEAYDPLLQPLPDLIIERDCLQAFNPQSWLANPNADEPYLRELLPLTQSVADETRPQPERKTASAELKKCIAEIKKANATRFKEVQRMVRDLTKLRIEFQEKEDELRQHAEREIILAKETTVDLLRISSDPLETRRYFDVVDRAEIEENEFNLNLPRYVNTFEPEEDILIEDALRELEAVTQLANIKLQELKSKLAKANGT